MNQDIHVQGDSVSDDRVSGWHLPHLSLHMLLLKAGRDLSRSKTINLTLLLVLNASKEIIYGNATGCRAANSSVYLRNSNGISLGVHGTSCSLGKNMHIQYTGDHLQQVAVGSQCLHAKNLASFSRPQVLRCKIIPVAFVRITGQSKT